MAELYPIGEQRIFYRATSDSDDLIVSAVIFDPSLVFSYSLTGTDFCKLKDRIYSTLFTFDVEGIWIAIFYENGVETATQAYNTKKLPAIGEFKGGNKGPNVIG